MEEGGEGEGEGGGGGRRGREGGREGGSSVSIQPCKLSTTVEFRTLHIWFMCFLTIEP